MHRMPAISREIKMNLLQTIQDCLSSIEAVKNKNSSRLPPKAIRNFDLAEGFLLRAMHYLREINDNAVELTSIDDDSGSSLKARCYFSELPSGKITSTELKTLIDLSCFSLQRLREGGVDVSEINKFSDQQMDLARRIGPDFSAMEKIWADWKFNSHNNKNHLIWIPKRGATEEGGEFIPNKWFKSFYNLIRPIYSDEIHPVLILHDYRKGRSKLDEIKSQNWKDLTRYSELWQPLKDGWRGFDNPKNRLNNQVMVQLGAPNDPAMFQFLTGGWFEAYVAHQFEDHLSRVNIPNETYTRVKYKTVLHSSVDGIDTTKLGGHFQGEIDVIVATQNKIVCIECKSGKLNPEITKRTIQRRDVIRGVLNEVGLDSNMAQFVLVHAQNFADNQVISSLRENQIITLSPADVGQFARGFADS
jgi:hypothetical protein